jgi:hypothetical protein
MTKKISNPRLMNKNFLISINFLELMKIYMKMSMIDSSINNNKIIL